MKKDALDRIGAREISMLARQRLDRRIGDRDTLITEFAFWENARNEQASTIHWQFTIDDTPM